MSILQKFITPKKSVLIRKDRDVYIIESITAHSDGTNETVGLSKGLTVDSAINALKDGE